MKKIAIIMAMQGEADPIIAALSLRAERSNQGEGWIAASAPPPRNDDRLPIRLFYGQLEHREIILATNGKDARTGADLIHSQPATLTTNHVIERFDPDLIISAGTAGGVSKHGAEIGDVYLSQGLVRYHDRRCPIHGLEACGVGGYATWDPPFEKGGQGGFFKRGRVSSGDSLYMGIEEQAQFDANEATVKDMEAAAVAWVASLYNKPFIAVKVITDLIDNSCKVEEQFLKNFELATQNLSKKIPELLLNLDSPLH
jgi:5'-methylthioadenosine nucleosidase